MFFFFPVTRTFRERGLLLTRPSKKIFTKKWFTPSFRGTLYAIKMHVFLDHHFLLPLPMFSENSNFEWFYIDFASASMVFCMFDFLARWLFGFRECCFLHVFASASNVSIVSGTTDTQPISKKNIEKSTFFSYFMALLRFLVLKNQWKSLKIIDNSRDKDARRFIHIYIYM